MKSKIALLARVQQKFVPVPFYKKQPQIVPNAGSYYARFTENGSRVMKPLGSDFTNAILTFQNLELAREYQDRNLQMPSAQVKITAPSCPTLAVKVEQYCEEISANKGLATYRKYSHNVKRFLRFCPRATVPEITREDMLAYKTFLKAEKLAPRSIHQTFLETMIFLKWCGAKIPLKHADWPTMWEREPEAYTEEEITALLNAANEEERLLLSCFLCSGFRSGEIEHLTYGDIDFKHSVWTVQAKEQFAWQPKKNKSRDVPVPEWLTAKLEARMAAGHRSRKDLVFFNACGEPDRICCASQRALLSAPSSRVAWMTINSAPPRSPAGYATATRSLM